MNYQKYQKPYFMPPQTTYDWVKKTEIEKYIALCRQAETFQKDE